jgi:hypothetical protein
MPCDTIGVCPICDRVMLEGDPYVDKHHLIPKSQNGAHGPCVTIHRICHEKIHSLWSEPELAGCYNTVERIMEAPEMKKYKKWVAKKPPNYYAKTKRSNLRGPRRR